MGDRIWGQTEYGDRRDVPPFILREIGERPVCPAFLRVPTLAGTARVGHPAWGERDTIILMQKLPIALLFAAIVLSPALAQSKNTYSQPESVAKLEKKQAKAQKKYAKRQKKAEKKMLKTERKNTHYPLQQF